MELYFIVVLVVIGTIIGFMLGKLKKHDDLLSFAQTATKECLAETQKLIEAMDTLEKICAERVRGAEKDITDLKEEVKRFPAEIGVLKEDIAKVEVHLEDMVAKLTAESCQNCACAEEEPLPVEDERAEPVAEEIKEEAPKKKGRKSKKAKKE